MANRVISTDLWNDKKWVELANIRTRYVWLYLLTCPLSNSCGVFKLPLKYVCADTLLDIEEIKRSFRELQDLRLMIYDIKSEEIAIVRYPIYNLRHITPQIILMVANGLKKVKNTNLVKAVYLSLCNITDENKQKDFEPLIVAYDNFLQGKGQGKGKGIGKENYIRKDKVKVKDKGVGLGFINENKESIYQNTKENKIIEDKEIDNDSWDSLINELNNDGRALGKE